MDTIQVSGLRLYAYHGCNESERRDGQVFLLDIGMEADLSTACQSDDLNDTVNYSAAMKCAAEAFTGEAYHLIERAAEAAAQAVLDGFPPVQGVTIRVHTPDAPVRLPVQDIFVEIKRRRRQGFPL